VKSADLRVHKAAPNEFSLCLAIRREVFVDEQGVQWEEEVDGLDAESVHFLAYSDDESVGTARLRVTPEGHAKAERVAVRSSWRKRGVGRLLMETLEMEACGAGHPELALAAQVAVIPFYERIGYRAEGPEFMDARIVHRMMRKELNRR
jgi:predicted GNAT family N-acyltransferase